MGLVLPVLVCLPLLRHPPSPKSQTCSPGPRMVPLARSRSATRDTCFRSGSPRRSPAVPGLFKEITKEFSLRSCWEPGWGPLSPLLQRGLKPGLRVWRSRESWTGMWSQGRVSRSQRAHQGGPSPRGSTWYLGVLYDPTSNPNSVSLPTEWRWQRATHEGGDCGGFSAEGGSGPGRQPRQRQARQAEGRVHEDPGPAAGRRGHCSPPPQQCAPAVCGPSPARIPGTTFPPAAQRKPPRQDCPIGPSSRLLLALPIPVLWVWFRTYVLSEAASIRRPLTQGRESPPPTAPRGGGARGLMSPPAPVPGPLVQPALGCGRGLDPP